MPQLPPHCRRWPRKQPLQVPRGERRGRVGRHGSPALFAPLLPRGRTNAVGRRNPCPRAVSLDAKAGALSHTAPCDSGVTGNSSYQDLRREQHQEQRQDRKAPRLLQWHTAPPLLAVPVQLSRLTARVWVPTRRQRRRCAHSRFVVTLCKASRVGGEGTYRVATNQDWRGWGQSRRRARRPRWAQVLSIVIHE